MMENEALDRLLRSAMQARPSATPGIDIAAAALRRARAHREAMERLARIGWWTRICSAAAVVLITATVAVGYWLWPASSGSSTTDATTSTLSSGTYTVDMMTVGVAAFVVMLVTVALLAVMTPERSQLRLAVG